jgi:hypothetical protein
MKKNMYEMQERLVAVMEFINELLQAEGKDGYFTYEDEADLMSWTNKCAKQVVRAIRDNLRMGWRKERNVSPFCQKCYEYRMVCSECAYGMRHGMSCHTLDVRLDGDDLYIISMIVDGR